jgi:hypothetical protein
MIQILMLLRYNGDILDVYAFTLQCNLHVFSRQKEQTEVDEKVRFNLLG